MEEIKVYVIDKGRTNLYLCYIDPLTSKQVTKSAKTANRSKADKAAGVWEDELRSGRYQKPNRMTWEAFREHYSTNALPGLAPRTADTVTVHFKTGHSRALLKPAGVIRACSSSLL